MRQWRRCNISRRLQKLGISMLKQLFFSCLAINLSKLTASLRLHFERGWFEALVGEVNRVRIWVGLLPIAPFFFFVQTRCKCWVYKTFDKQNIKERWQRKREGEERQNLIILFSLVNSSSSSSPWLMSVWADSYLNNISVWRKRVERNFLHFKTDDGHLSLGM